MGNFQNKIEPKVYDSIIIGSGAGGGMATYVLANAGLKVCLIEAGPMYDPAKNSRAKLTEQTYQKDANIRIFP